MWWWTLSLRMPPPPPPPAKWVSHFPLIETQAQAESGHRMDDDDDEEEEEEDEEARNPGLISALSAI